MSHVMGIVYSNTAVDSTANIVSINSHTASIYFHNTNESTDAVVKLNGGPHQVLIPANKNYVEIPGNYTKFQVVTESVVLAVYAVA
jgi:hypothetical protein